MLFILYFECANQIIVQNIADFFKKLFIMFTPQSTTVLHKHLEIKNVRKLDNFSLSEQLIGTQS